MSAFIELVILPAALPLLIVLVMGRIEDRLDCQPQREAPRDIPYPASTMLLSERLPSA